jgi:hypothetical protein
MPVEKSGFVMKSVLIVDSVEINMLPTVVLICKNPAAEYGYIDTNTCFFVVNGDNVNEPTPAKVV